MGLDVVKPGMWVMINKEVLDRGTVDTQGDLDRGIKCGSTAGDEGEDQLDLVDLWHLVIGPLDLSGQEYEQEGQQVEDHLLHRL